MEMNEMRRFETLMSYFMNPESFQIDFMVACMQFINIVVHSVEDMNFRVALQWEFTNLKLNECLEKLRHHESEELAVQISGTNFLFYVNKFKGLHLQCCVKNCCSQFDMNTKISNDDL